MIMIAIHWAFLVISAPALAVNGRSGNHLTLTYAKSRGGKVAQASAEPSWPWQGADRAIVVARLDEDVSWLLQYFSEIPIAVYQSQDPGDPRYFKGEKGREALGWLNFIIDNYHYLPETTIMIHAHRCSWHHGDYVPRIKHLRFGQLDFAPLGIPPTPDPPTGKSLPPQVGGQRWKIDFNVTAGRTVEQLAAGDTDSETGAPLLELNINNIRDVLAITWTDMFGDALGSVPAEIEHPVGASFMVSKAAIHRHPQAFYEHLAKWLVDTPLLSQYSARLCEYTWHIIFGEPALMIHHAPCDIYVCDKDGHLPFLTIDDCPINMTTYRPVVREE